MCLITSRVLDLSCNPRHREVSPSRPNRSRWQCKGRPSTHFDAQRRAITRPIAGRDCLWIAIGVGSRPCGPRSLSLRWRRAAVAMTAASQLRTMRPSTPPRTREALAIHRGFVQWATSAAADAATTASAASSAPAPVEPARPAFPATFAPVPGQSLRRPTAVACSAAARLAVSAARSDLT